MNHNLSFLNWLKSALFPLKCLVCATEGAVLCQSHHHFKPAEKVSLSSNSALSACFAAADYNQKVSRSLVKALKFRRHKPAAKLIARTLENRIPWQGFSEATLVPVPLHWRRQHWRGFNQSEIIAKNIKRPPNITLNNRLIKRIKYTSQQARLGQKDRSSNLEKAFVWRPQERLPKTVILLDDVMTTGSTLEAAAKALKQAGVEQVVGVAFAYQAKGG